MYGNKYSRIADALVSDGYIVLDNVLGDIVSENLFLYAKKYRNIFSEAAISNVKHIDRKVRSDKTLWIDEEDFSEESYLKFMKGLMSYLNEALYIGLNSYEFHFAIYDKGDFYEKHLDIFHKSKNRIVTVVYYLNNLKNRGELILYDKDERVLEIIRPKKDRLVVFLSDRFPHEVKRTENVRYSITGWFRRD